MASTEYEKQVRKLSKVIKQELVATATAGSKLEYDTNCLKVLDDLNDFMEFISKNNPKIHQ